jgi:hypothetical protein
MGALEFIASIIGSLTGLVGSLAWPALVLILLWFNRHRLANLSDWIEELTIPGGAKIKFAKGLTALNEATERAGLLAPKVQDAQAKDNIGDLLADLAKQFPEIAVIEIFREVERTLWVIASSLTSFSPPLLPPVNPERALAHLVQLGYIDENAAQLFENLKDGRDAALIAVRNNSPRATAATRLWPEHALRFLDASKALNMKLREVLASLEHHRRKPERGTPPPAKSDTQPPRGN